MLEYHQKSQEGKDDPYHQNGPIKSVWNGYNRLVDVMLWLHGSLVIYICAVWLAPMLLLWGIGNFIDLRPMLKGKFNWWLMASLAGIPVWLIISGYASLNNTNWARRIRLYAHRFVIVLGLVLIGAGLIGWIIESLN